MFDFKSANISQDGELVMPAMRTPGEFSIECDRSDTDHVCLGKIRDNYGTDPFFSNSAVEEVSHVFRAAFYF